MIEPAEKLSVKYDKDAINTIELVIHGESHTLANMVREEILQDDSCTFCGYKMAHPSDSFVSMRISAVENRPVRLMVLDSLRALSRDIDGLVNQARFR